MSLDPDSSKQDQEVICSRKTNEVYHSPNEVYQLPNEVYLIFNSSTVIQTVSQKHINTILDSRLTFNDHLNSVLSKTEKAMGLFCKLQKILSKPALMTIYKAFVRLQLDYDDRVYDQAYTSSLHHK